ncbi:MAG TPA: MFS transporter [Stellaceae bacterium]|nr:MFS transporter [Stellaceae bacterium]
MTPSARVVRFINIAHALDHLMVLIFPTAVLGMSQSFSGSYGGLLALSVGGAIAFGAGSLPAGWLGDHWSQRNMMTVFFIGVGAAALLTATSTTPFMLAASVTLLGLFAAIYHPVGTAMLVANADKLGRTIGVNGVWGNMGVAAAAIIAGTLTQYLGWRWAFAVPGVASIALGIVFHAMVPDQAAQKKAAARKAAALPRSVIVHAFSVLVLVAASGSVVFQAITNSMPKVFDERFSLLAGSPFRIGVLVAVVYVIGAMAQLVVGHFVDRHPLRTVFLPLSLIQGPCLLLAAWAQDWWMLALALAITFGIFGQVTINDAMVARYTDQAWRARAYAFRYVVSFGAGACAIPLVALLHERAGGFTVTFLVLAAFGSLVFVGALLFPHRPEELAVLPVHAQPAE